MDINKFCLKQKKFIDSDSKNLNERREEWKDLKERIECKFRKIIETCKNIEFYENLYCRENPIPGLIESANQNFFEIKFGSHPMGIFMERNKINTQGAEPILEKESKLETENGAALIISQAPTGAVITIFYLPKSSLYKNKDNYIIFKYFSAPSKVSNRHIDILIKRLFWLNRIYSHFHSLTYRDIFTAFIWKNWKKIIMLIPKIISRIALKVSAEDLIKISDSGNDKT